MKKVIKDQINKIDDINIRKIFISYLKQVRVEDKQKVICNIIYDYNDYLIRFLDIFEKYLPSGWEKDVLIDYIGCKREENYEGKDVE